MTRFSVIINKTLLALIIWRLLSTVVVQTFHVPDEYWQSLEVAHKLAFNYGYLTWEWRSAIRSYLYPFVISILYSVMKILHIDYTIMLIMGPRVCHALLSAYADYKFYKWTRSKIALLSLCINWYWYYCATRTLINSFETCLTTIALSMYPWKNNAEKTSQFLWIVGFMCFARPTAAIFWLPLCLYQLIREPKVISKYIQVGFVVFIISTAIDMACYGALVSTPFNFMLVNVIEGVSEQYGKMHPLWYFFSGLPVLLGINYALFLIAIYLALRNRARFPTSFILSLTMLCSLTVYSLISHKEFRFILPILPMVIYIINECVFASKSFKVGTKFTLLLICSNVFPGLYFSIFHQRGPLNAIHSLKNEIDMSDSLNDSVLFLTNCHATPYYSHVHKDIPMRFLTCEPNLTRVQNFSSEQDDFFDSPMEWLQKNYLSLSPIHFPRYVLTYDSIAAEIAPFLSAYKELASFGDIHFSQHGNFSELTLYKLNSPM